MKPVVFDGCFGWLHPGNGTHGVVLCGPFGAESRTVHRSWRELAERLAAAGLPTLRFDYPGTGDSTDEAQSPDTPEAWLRSVHGAVAFLRRNAAIDKLTLIGFRFGATLAVACAEQLDGVDGLVLLAPVSSGRAYGRELSMLARLNQRPEDDGRSEAAEPHGILLTAKTAAHIGRFEILQGARRPAARALILTPAGAPADPNFVGRLRTIGVEVQEGEFIDHACLRWYSTFSPYPIATFDRVIEWMAPGVEPPTGPSPCAGAVDIPVPGVRETAVVFGPPPGLFGVACAPLEPQARPPPALVFLSPGTETHVGGDRMWVSMARQFARAGFTSLRFDIGGIGDSPARADPGEPSTHLELAVADVRAALDWLETRGVSRVVCVGHCLGAKLACSIAESDPRVVAQLLVNPFLPFTEEASHTPGRYLKEAYAPSSWRRLLSGEIPVARLEEAAIDLTRGVLMKFGRRLSGREAPAETAAKYARAFAARGVDTLLIYGEDDPLLEELEEFFGADRRQLPERLAVRIRLVTSAKHNFPRRSDRDRLAGAIAEHLCGGHSSFEPPHAPRLPKSAAGRNADAVSG